jgi:hypothetical protein
MPWRSRPEYRPVAARWVDAPGIGRLNTVLRRVFWSEAPAPGDSHAAVTEHLRQATRILDTLPDLVTAVRREQIRTPGLLLFGDPLAVPSVALAARVPIAGDVADTNPQRFDAGSLTFADVRHLLDGSPNIVLLLRGWGFGSAPGIEQRRYLQEHYDQVAAFDSAAGFRHALLRRKPDHTGP